MPAIQVGIAPGDTIRVGGRRPGPVTTITGDGTDIGRPFDVLAAGRAALSRQGVARGPRDAGAGVAGRYGMRGRRPADVMTGTTVRR